MTARQRHDVVILAALLAGLCIPAPAPAQSPPEATKPEDTRNFSRSELLLAARTLAICTRDSHIPVDTLTADLLASKGFRDLDLTVIRNTAAADLLVQIDHPLHLFDYSFIVIDRRTSVVLASDSLIAWDGIRASPWLVKKIVAGLRDAQQSGAPQLKRRSQTNPDAQGDSK